MERFFIDQPLQTGTLEITDEEQAFKISTVLRGNVGDKIAVFGSNQKEFAAQIKGINRKWVGLELGEEIRRGTEPATKVFLYPSLIKKNRFETVIEKCTEIGVAEFRPVLTERSVVKTDEPPERWRKIAIEAAQQSGRLIVPEIKAPVPLREALEKIQSGKIVVAAEKQQRTNPAEILPQAGQEFHLFVGPEGGWFPEEIELFKKYDPIILNLGARILRAETANIVFSAFCIYLGKE